MRDLLLEAAPSQTPIANLPRQLTAYHAATDQLRLRSSRPMWYLCLPLRGPRRSRIGLRKSEDTQVRKAALFLLLNGDGRPQQTVHI